MINIDFERIEKDMGSFDIWKYEGIVSQVIGITIEAEGIKSYVGEVCLIYNNMNIPVPSETVGFKDKKIILMVLGEVTGISTGCKVTPTGKCHSIKCSFDLCGKVLDGLGNPIDGGEIQTGDIYSIDREPPSPLKRRRIKSVLPTGVRAIDGFLTCGEGQRVGIFAGSGVGKSTLLGMMARYSEADVNVIALIGERGREVLDFIEKDLGIDGLKKSVIVCATSDKPALVRQKGAFTATAIAEYFRDQGKKVMLMMDSVTRFAMAQREIGLAIGEPPATKGYTPSVFAMLPKLMERTGMSDKGSITAFYTVLVDGDDFNEPIADAARSILDGHIVLSRDLAAKNHYPAIDVLNSISRLMSDITEENHKSAASKARDLLSVYKESEDLINIGAYVKGSSSKIDEAIKYHDKIDEYLKQRVEENNKFDDSLEKLTDIFTVS
jgi:flagellum-specific ATP synthase